MKVTERSDKVELFENLNSDLPGSSESGVIINILETPIGSLRVMIDVSESAINQQLRDAIPLALRWRDRLIQYQGKTGVYEANTLLADFWKDHNPRRRSDRYTYNEIADGINAKLAEYLYEQVGIQPPNLGIHPYKQILDLYLFGEKVRVPDPLDRARQLMKILHIRDKQGRELIDEGLKNIEAGDKPFSKGSPITKTKLLKTMKWWRSSS